MHAAQTLCMCLHFLQLPQTRCCIFAAILALNLSDRGLLPTVQISVLSDWSFAYAAAHGLAGILHTLALAHKEFPHHDLRMELDVDLVALIRSSTLALIDRAFPSGNLPPSHGSGTDK